MTDTGTAPNRSAAATWRRRLLHLAGRAGLTVTDVGAGTALVSRGKRPTTVRRLGAHAWLVDSGRSSRVVKIGKQGWLVTESVASPADELTLETQLSRELGLRHVAWLLERYAVDCVLDIGANNGQYARNLRRNGYRGHIVSFEPVPAYAEAIGRLCADDPKWTVRQHALGSSEGSVPIHVQRTFSSFLPSSEYGRQRFSTLRELADTEQVDVPLRRLDAILDEVLAPVVASGVAQPRVFLKMDTQGFDLEVFRGLGERVSDIAAMQSEVALLMIYEQMPRMPEALATYEAAGFEISGLYPVNREKDGRVIEYDCVMVRPGALAG